MTNPEIQSGKLFTDRGHGEGLVLSEYTSGSWRESKHIKANCIHFCSIRPVKGKLLGMCQQVNQLMILLGNKSIIKFEKRVLFFLIFV